MCAWLALKTSISQCCGKYEKHKQYEMKDDGLCHSKYKRHSQYQLTDEG